MAQTWWLRKLVDLDRDGILPQYTILVGTLYCIIRLWYHMLHILNGDPRPVDKLTMTLVQF